jgi:basic amino acid/polyamine antiporter, APA family
MTAKSKPAADSSDAGFRRQLGLFDCTMLVAGAMIGSGIFIVSAEIARDTGGAGWLLAVWIVAGLMTILGALCYAELAAMMPHAGGQYVFLREAYGPLWGFLYGWTLFLVIQTGTIAAVAVAFAKFLGVLVPELGEKYILLDLGPLRISSGQIVAVLVILLLTFVNSRGINAGRLVQNVFTVAKTGALILLILLGIFVAAKSEIWASNVAELWSGMKHTEKFKSVHDLVPLGTLLPALMVMGGVMVGALFSSDAWNNVTFAASEVKNPSRTVPLSLALGTGLVILLYLLANVAYLAALPLEAIAHAKDARVGTALMEVIAPTWGVAAMAVAIMISTFGCVNGLILAGARLYYAMAKDGLLFQAVGRLNSKGVPGAGLWLQAGWAILLTFTGTYGQLLDYVIFAALLFYMLTVVGLFLLRFRQPERERPFRVIGYPVLPALYILLCGLVMLDLLIVKPLYTWPGLLIVLAGIPAYILWQRGSSKVRQ